MKLPTIFCNNSSLNISSWLRSILVSSIMSAFVSFKAKSDNESSRSFGVGASRMKMSFRMSFVGRPSNLIPAFSNLARITFGVPVK